jgi:iron complex outermembrane recepter protein
MPHVQSITRPSLAKRESAPAQSKLGTAIATALIAGLTASTSTVIAQTSVSGEAVASTDSSSTAGGSGIEEVVVVRSRNRLEPLHDVPISISVINGPELERENSLDLGDITKRAANVSWNTGNPRQGSLSIRGVGKQAQTDAQDPSVGVIVDGVNYAYNALSFYDFQDVETVEVARGPQGTLLGKNTTMGVVNITSKRPSFDPDFDYSITYGELDTIIGEAAGGGPIIDDLLAWRGTFYIDKQNGAFPNVYDNGTRSYTDKNRMYGRAQFLLKPTENFSARFTLEVAPRSGENTNGLTFYKQLPPYYSDGSPVNLGNDPSTKLARRWFTQESNYTYLGDFVGSGERGTTDNDQQRALVTGTNGASAWLDWNLGELTLTSITAFKDYYFDARNDEGTPFDITLNSNTTVHYEQRSQELRLSSGTSRFVDWQTGLFVLDSTNRVNSKQEWGSDAGAWFATNAQYATLDTNTSGRALLQTSLERAYRLRTDFIDNNSAAIFGQANWHFGEKLTLTTGVRFTHEDRGNRSLNILTDNGYGAELNPVAINNVGLGGFASNATTGALLPGNSVAQLSLADFLANKYFGATTGATPGQAYAGLTAAQLRQVAAAKSVRQTQIGVLWDTVDAAPFKKTQPAYVLSPTYRINDALNFYVSWQYGEKAGIAQFTNGLPNNALPEKNSAYEIGVKSFLANRTLVLNTDVFVNNIEDYQQSVQVLDQYTTNLRNDGQFYYTAATGNVPKVRVKGVEVDASYNGIKNFSLRLSGAYNDAVYVDFPNSAQPPENGYPGAAPYQDVSGQPLPGAPKYSFSLGGEYRRPLRTKEFHTSFNYFHTDGYNSDNTLSSYGWIDDYSLTDFSIGIGNPEKGFDVSLLVKNAGDTAYRAVGWASWTPNPPRWVGVIFRGRL